MTCLKGHTVRFYPNGVSKTRRIQTEVRVIIEKVHLPNRICNCCLENFVIADHGGYYSCEENCDFDLCAACGRCGVGGHTYTICRENPYGQFEFGENPCCNHCIQTIPEYQIDIGYLRCNICDYNVCRGCLPYPVPKSHSQYAAIIQ